MTNVLSPVWFCPLAVPEGTADRLVRPCQQTPDCRVL